MLLTFDDGYIDHYQEVYPILKKYGVQGSFFPNGMAVKEHKLLTVNRIHFILAAAEAKDKYFYRELVQECFSLMDEYRNQGVRLKSNEEYYTELAIPNRWDPGGVIFVKRLLQNALPENIRTAIAMKLFEKYVTIFTESINSGKTGRLKQVLKEGTKVYEQQKALAGNYHKRGIREKAKSCDVDLVKVLNEYEIQINSREQIKVTYGDKVFTTSRNKVVAWKRINAKEGIVEEQQ